MSATTEELGALKIDDHEPGSQSDLRGTWSPPSADLARELPALITELHLRGTRIFRVAYNRDRWDPAPRSLRADGRVVRLGWFLTLDPDRLILQGSNGERIDLTVPPVRT